MRNDQQPAQQAQVPVQVKVTCNSGRRIENIWGEFDGDVTLWQGFHDRFKAAVHDNDDIPRIFKFQHLMSSLKGAAKSDVGEWPQSDAGYEELWARVKQLYMRKYEASMKLLQKFFELPKLERASGYMLQKLCNSTHETVRQLRTLQYPVEYYDLFIVFAIHQRLDPDTSKAWELERPSDTPTIEQMLSFLDKQAKAAAFYSRTNKDNRKRASSGRDDKTDAKRPKLNESKSDPKGGNRACKVCKESHGVHNCPTFRKMTLNERRKCARENELCYNCLNPSHSSKDCRSAACKRCVDKKHNSLLCPENPFNRNVNSVQIKSNSKKKGRANKFKSN